MPARRVGHSQRVTALPHLPNGQALCTGLVYATSDALLPSPAGIRASAFFRAHRSSQVDWLCQLDPVSGRCPVRCTDGGQERLGERGGKARLALCLPG